VLSGGQTFFNRLLKGHQSAFVSGFNLTQHAFFKIILSDAGTCGLFCKSANAYRHSIRATPDVENVSNVRNAGCECSLG